MDQLEEYYNQGTFVVDDTNWYAVELAANTSRQTAAEWLRTAFHDMSTHNVNTGIGGLDASLAYELDHDENKGQGLFDTFTFLAAHFMSKYSSAAYLLVMWMKHGQAGKGRKTTILYLKMRENM
jgi:hypothetical protein